MTPNSNITVRARSLGTDKSLTPPNPTRGSQKSPNLFNCERLFLCPEMDFQHEDQPVFPRNNTRFLRPILGLGTALNELLGNGLIEVRLDKKLPKCLAFKANIYYNIMLYIVGLRLMHGVAKLRKVAEVFITDFNYLGVPHIANSKRTVVAK